MKRFSSEGSNAQEQRQLISAQSDSLAGVTLLSSGLAAPGKAVIGLGGGHFLKNRDYITLECLGDKPGPRYLDGRTHNGTVGLAPHTNPPFTGTRWRVHYLKPSADNQEYWIYDHIFLYCEGTGPGDYRYLDGRTHNGTVGLAPHTNPPYTGTRWHLTTNSRNVQNPNAAGYFLECLGEEPGPRWLDGRTDNGDVVLSPTRSAPYTGTRWWIAVVDQA
jgi:hypothetical protein